MNVSMGSEHGEPQEETRVYLFADAYEAFVGTAERPSASVLDAMRAKLGGKGAVLAIMAGSGVRTPPGLTITTDCCQAFHDNGDALPAGLLADVLFKLERVEAAADRTLGEEFRPLLVSVRSGAKSSMPGMMDTILNLGLNDETIVGLVNLTGNEQFAWDSYRRFVQMYSTVVLGISPGAFEQILENFQDFEIGKETRQLSAAELKQVVTAYKELVLKETGKAFPSDVFEQLEGAISAVFKSWNNERAVFYRTLNNIDHNLGTAVTVQAMVFGNMGDDSATGVCFTRNPNTGEPCLFGEYLINAQGEDVVDGSRTPMDIASLEQAMPDAHAELVLGSKQLEAYYADMQDIEFTIEQGVLWFLQTRTGKRSAAAAVRIAVDLTNEEVITREVALTRIDPLQLEHLLLPSIDPAQKKIATEAGQFLAKGLAASPGAATGLIVFDPDEAAGRGLSGEKVILFRVETCPDDIHGIHHAKGVVTSRGGMTSHAAVVARGMGRPCVVGCDQLRIDLVQETVTVGSQTLNKGDIVTIDGSTGELFLGELDTREPELTPEFDLFMYWASQESRLTVRANADTPADAKVARDFGAKGIGLCRTEHMFMDKNRLPVMRRMVMANGDAERQSALAELLPMQRDDFKGIFHAMNGLPVTIRLLDIPLHEILAGLGNLAVQVAVLEATGSTNLTELAEKRRLLLKERELHEVNPMMGLRGCRMGLLHQEISIMQVRAIFEAAIAATREGCSVSPEIMIPLVGHVNELQVAREVLEQVARDIMDKEGVIVPYQFGTMIEVPRACLVAGALAEVGEFFSFGTNDLTQMTFGYSRDDAEGNFLRHYIDGVLGKDGEKRQILSENPFVVLDRDGVGALMRLAVEAGVRSRPNLKLGLCGEHGGEPNSIAFAHEIGLHYVSCSPFRVPVARLAAAQAHIAALRLQAEEAFSRR